MSQDPPTLKEFLYVAIHAAESIAAGMDGDNPFEPDEHRTLFVYREWTRCGS